MVLSRKLLLLLADKLLSRRGEFCRAEDWRISQKLRFELEARVQPTDWHFSKSEAIDYSEPFVWFDDNAPIHMLAELKCYDANASKNFYWVNSSDPESAKKMLEFLKERVATEK